jgi:polyisoprenoid-binding protein YceI
MSNVETATTATGLPAPGVWKIDPAHTTVGFVARHLMVTKVRGRFADVEGEVHIAEQPEQSSVRARIKTASIDTGSQDRDAHLRSPDFFDVDQYPAIEFLSNRITGSGSDWTLEGDLTVKGITRPVTLDVELEGVTADPWGGHRAGFTARTEVDREDWGLTWNVVLESGGVVVSRKVKLELDIQLVRDPVQNEA